MKITIKDTTPKESTLEFIKFDDVFGKALLIKGWK